MLTVLVLDDDFRVADLHAGIVTAQPGFRALPPVRTLQAARERLAAGEVDLLLADQYVPDGRGVDLIGSFDGDSLLLTADRSTTTARLALARGAFGILYKPFDAKELTSRLTAYARYRRILGTASDLDQEALDRALKALYSLKSPGGEAASENATFAALAAILAEHPEGLTAAETAERAGVSRPTAQRHLSAAARSGTVALELRYGTTGRPEHVYRLAGPAA